MSSIYDVQHIKIRAIHDNVIISDMDFGEMKTESGIVIRSDDGQSHGVKPRWGHVYKVGPTQTEIKEGQWILVEHGRWTRKVKINDGEKERSIQKVEVKSILAVSDEAPGTGEVLIQNSGF
jgi:co-chaperonin GroES (HSP10)